MEVNEGFDLNIYKEVEKSVDQEDGQGVGNEVEQVHLEVDLAIVQETDQEVHQEDDRQAEYDFFISTKFILI